MSCQCHQVGGPFIAEDPDCLVHGAAARTRERQVESLVAQAETEDDPDELRRIIGELASIATDLAG